MVNGQQYNAKIKNMQLGVLPLFYYPNVVNIAHFNHFTHDPLSKLGSSVEFHFRATVICSCPLIFRSAVMYVICFQGSVCVWGMIQRQFIKIIWRPNMAVYDLIWKNVLSNTNALSGPSRLLCILATFVMTYIIHYATVGLNT